MADKVDNVVINGENVSYGYIDYYDPSRIFMTIPEAFKRLENKLGLA